MVYVFFVYVRNMLPRQELGSTVGKLAKNWKRQLWNHQWKKSLKVGGSSVYNMKLFGVFKKSMNNLLKIYSNMYICVFCKKGHTSSLRKSDNPKTSGALHWVCCWLVMLRLRFCGSGIIILLSKVVKPVQEVCFRLFRIFIQACVCECLKLKINHWTN